MGLDETLARGHFFAHQFGKHLVGFHEILDAHFQHLARFRVHRGFPKLFGVHFAQALVARHFGLALRLVVGQHPVFFLIAVGVFDAAAGFQAVQRRLGDVEKAVVDEAAHPAVEKGKDQGADVRAVHIGVGHYDYLVVAHLVGLEIFALAGADGRHHRPDFFVAQDFVGLLQDPFHIQDFALERQDGLKVAVAAHLGGTAGRLALHDVEFRLGRVALGAVGQLAGQRGAVHGVLADDQFPRPLGRLPRFLRGEALVHHPLALGGVVFQIAGQPLAHHRLDDAAHFGVAQLGLGLPLELGVGELDADHRRQPLAHIFADEVGLVVFDEPLLAGVVVDDAGQGGAEAGHMAAALFGVDAVGERKDGFVDAVVILHRHLDGGVVDGLFVVERQGLHHPAVAVDIADEVGDAAVEVVGALAVAITFGGVPGAVEADFQPFVQIGDRLEMGGEQVEIVVDFGEDFRVGAEGDDGAVAGGGADLEQFGYGEALGVFLIVAAALAVDFGAQEFGEAVDHRAADAVQPAGDFVGGAFELAAGVEGGHHRFQGALAGVGVGVHRNPPAVVADGDGAVGVQPQVDAGAETGHGLIDGVVEDFVDEVMQAALVGAADIHTGAHPHRLQAAQHPDVFGRVVVHFREDALLHTAFTAPTTPFPAGRDRRRKRDA